MNKIELRLNTILKECEKHLSRMNSAFKKINSSLPLDENKYINLSEDEIEHIDQFLYRFTKLQDAIGERLFKAVLTRVGEETYKMTFIDIFNRLEQLEIIEDYDKWQELREIRNELAHEYEDEPKENAKRLNKIFQMKEILVSYFIKIENYLNKTKFN